MNPQAVYFATSNAYKFQEFERLFGRLGVRLERMDLTIPEIQTFNIDDIIRDKVIKAYAKLSRPVLVDHSGLAMRALNDLPQGLNNQFWDRLKDQVCVLAKKLGDPHAQSIVYLGFCDGQRVYVVSQSDEGRMAEEPFKGGTFHLDRVFIPDRCDITLAEMTDDARDLVSHRAKVAEKAVAMFKSIEFGKTLGLK